MAGSLAEPALASQLKRKRFPTRTPHSRMRAQIRGSLTKPCARRARSVRYDARPATPPSAEPAGASVRIQRFFPMRESARRAAPCRAMQRATRLDGNERPEGGEGLSRLAVLL